jgi:hypothetical protein
MTTVLIAQLAGAVFWLGQFAIGLAAWTPQLATREVIQRVQQRRLPGTSPNDWLRAD